MVDNVDNITTTHQVAVQATKRNGIANGDAVLFPCKVTSTQFLNCDGTLVPQELELASEVHPLFQPLLDCDRRSLLLEIRLDDELAVQQEAVLSHPVMKVPGTTGGLKAEFQNQRHSTSAMQNACVARRFVCLTVAWRPVFCQGAFS